MKQLSSLSFRSIVDVLFKKSEFYPQLLQQKLTTEELFSYCGGSLGLFLGFSVISAIELVYYLTLRVICARKRSREVHPIVTDSKFKRDNFCIETMDNSSIHGFNQISKEDRHLLERFEQIWLFLFNNYWIFFKDHLVDSCSLNGDILLQFHLHIVSKV